jgi:predicted nuclease of predicted toxin-antitoxin system
LKFLIDAHLPKKLAELFVYKGYDAIHTSDLVHKNHSTDTEINTISINEKRVVITKDLDFVDSMLISEKPYKLIYLTTGNITNKNLLEHFGKNMDTIIKSIEEARLVEISLTHITVKL